MDEDDSGLRVVFRAEDDMEMRIAKAALERNGIPVLVRSYGSSQYSTVSSLDQGIMADLLVYEEDFEEGQEVLRRLINDQLGLCSEDLQNSEDNAAAE